MYRISDSRITLFIFPTALLRILLLSEVLLPTDAQVNCYKTIIQIYIKSAGTCYGVITVIRERTV